MCEENVIGQSNERTNFNCSSQKAAGGKTVTYVLVRDQTDVNQTTYLHQLSLQATSSTDVEKLLDLVDWKIFVCTCVNRTTCSENVPEKWKVLSSTCQNATCCFSNHVADIFFPIRHCNSGNCSSFREFVQGFPFTAWYIFLILGCICLFGNFVVIIQKITNLRDKQQRYKEIKIYNTLVLSLSLSDLLMGSYLVMIAVEIKLKTENNIYYSELGFCNALGMINLISSQVSITTLTTISFYRLIGVTHPYKNQHLRLVVTLLVVTWFVWISFAVMTVLPVEPFESLFTYGLNYKDEDFALSFHEEVLLFRSFQTSQNDVSAVLNATIKYQTPSVLRKTLVQFGWVNLTSENWLYFGLYNFQYTCAMSVISTSTELDPITYFNLAILLYDVFASVAIVLAYSIVTISASGYERILCAVVRCQKLPKKEERVHQNNQNNRNNENQRLLSRISMVVITDLVCWLPVCITSIVFWNPKMLPNGKEFLKLAIEVQIVKIFVIPINSIFNPFIYSFPFWKKEIMRVKEIIFSELHCKKQSS